MSGESPRVACSDCGRKDLRVGYRCKRAPEVGHWCRRIRCWECADVKRVERKGDPGAYGFGWLFYAVVSQPLCKTCRAEETLTESKLGVSTL